MKNDKKDGKVVSESVEDLNSKLEIALKERKEYLDGWRRAKADSINEKKKVDTMLQMNLKIIVKQCVENILPVLDSFDSAFSNKEKWEKEVAEEWRKGMESINAQLKKVISDMGVEIIKVEIGDGFDPKFHEAVSIKKGEEGKVAEVLSAGYKLKDFVIRPSRVIIGAEDY